MDPALLWAVIGLALVVIELLTGTFYLLVLGLAAFGAAGAAWLNQPFSVQAVVCAVLAGLGCYLVHAWREKDAANRMPHIDAGQPANFENWVDQGARLARVRYRGASWDALVEGDAVPQGGAILYVLESSGNTLKVTARRPA